MKLTIRKNVRALSWLCMLIYFASYTTRINFAVMMIKICGDMQVPKTDLAVVVTAMTISYGAGQIVSGVIGDRVKPQRMIMMGLLLASASNVCITLCNSIAYMTVVWTFNGFAHAMLWPPIVRIFSTHLNDEEYGYGIVRVSWGSSFATILLYLACPLLLYVMNWRAVMLLCAAVGIGIMILWVALSPRLLGQTLETSDPRSPAPAKNEDHQGSVALPRYVIIPIILIIVGIIVQGILRDGVTNWMPFYLQETFSIAEENAIICTVILSLFSVVSFWVFDRLHARVFKNEIVCAAVIFAGSTVCAALLYFVDLLSASVALSMIFMAMIVAFMHGVNLMLISVVPKRFVRSGRVATFSGLFNAFTYVGSSVSTYGFAVLSDLYGWSFTLLMWVGVSLLGVVACLLAVSLWIRFCKEYAA